MTPSDLATAESVAALVAAPEGLGPQPIHLADPGDPVATEVGGESSGPAYLVVEHLPGHVRPASAWTDDLLAAHARQLARLHERAYPGHGDVSATERLAPRLSMVDTVDEGWQWWSEHHPELAGAPDVAALWPRVRRLAEATEPEFARLETFCLTHGDAAVTNILVSGGVPRYVDWEWARIGDPARDLGFIGGDVWLEPWYLDLGPDRLRRFLEAYVAAGGRGDVDALAARARCWLVQEALFVSLHFRRRAAEGAGEAYAVRAATLLGRLDAALG